MRPLMKTFKTGSLKVRTGNGRPYTRYRQNDPWGTREWRQASQFQITATDESDTDKTEHSSKPEMENPTLVTDQLDKMIQGEHESGDKHHSFKLLQLMN